MLMIVVLIIMLLTMPILSVAELTAPSTTTLSGIIYAPNGYTPLSGAAVTVDGVGTVYTDANGFYSIGGVPTAGFHITVALDSNEGMYSADHYGTASTKTTTLDQQTLRAIGLNNPFPYFVKKWLRSV